MKHQTNKMRASLTRYGFYNPEEEETEETEKESSDSDNTDN